MLDVPGQKRLPTLRCRTFKIGQSSTSAVPDIPNQKVVRVTMVRLSSVGSRESGVTLCIAITVLLAARTEGKQLFLRLCFSWLCFFIVTMQRMYTVLMNMEYSILQLTDIRENMIY